MKDKILRKEISSFTLVTSIHSDNARQILTISQGNDNRGCCLYISLILQNVIPSLDSLVPFGTSYVEFGSELWLVPFGTM